MNPKKSYMKTFLNVEHHEKNPINFHTYEYNAYKISLAFNLPREKNPMKLVSMFSSLLNSFNRKVFRHIEWNIIVL